MKKKHGRWVDQESPREKLGMYGPGYLTDEELIQIMLGSGVNGSSVSTLAKKIVAIINENPGALREDYKSLIKKLSNIRGMGSAKSCLFAASLELWGRVYETRSRVIREARDVLPLISSLGTKKQEYFVSINLNGGNRLISRRVITIGLLDQSLVHPREVFAEAISERAAKVIVAHNHPAGDLQPSQEDIRVTENLLRASSILGLELLDHFIITENGYFSFREAGML
ncbi:MAG: RadC family protein [Spirochaetota bacterium]